MQLAARHLIDICLDHDLVSEGVNMGSSRLCSLNTAGDHLDDNSHNNNQHCDIWDDRIKQAGEERGEAIKEYFLS